MLPVQGTYMPPRQTTPGPEVAAEQLVADASQGATEGVVGGVQSPLS